MLGVVDLRAAARRDLREAVSEHGADEARMMRKRAVYYRPYFLRNFGHEIP
jgi:hypothetical protein